MKSCARIVACATALSFAATLPSPADSSATRDACNQWLATGVQPQGVTRDDCHFARDKPQGSILRSGTSDTFRVWREQADHKTRFVLDTGSEPKESPK